MDMCERRDIKSEQAAALIEGADPAVPCELAYTHANMNTKKEAMAVMRRVF